MAKFCSHCGEEINEQAVVCPHCGCEVKTSVTEKDEANMGLNILSLLFPIIGLVLFCVNLNTKPVSAKSYGLWGLIGFIGASVIVGCTAML